MFKHLAVAAVITTATLTGCASPEPSSVDRETARFSAASPSAAAPSTMTAAPVAPVTPTADPARFFYDGWSATTGSARGYFFRSPTGKWRCAIVDEFYDGVGAGCESTQTTGRAMPVPGVPLVPANDIPENLVPATALVIKPGAGPEFIVMGQPYLVRPEEPTPVLDYGMDLTALGFTCNTQESGISCRNDASGAGFTFSSKGYKLEYTPVAVGLPAQAPAPADVDPNLVLGAPSDQYSMGYGTARPDTISTNSLCGNSIHDVSWESWGGPVARGAGTWCQSAGSQSRGEPPTRVSLTASDIGDCGGALGYRKLQFDDAEPQSICTG